MPLSISPAGIDDGHGYAEAYITAFFNESLHSALYGDMPFHVQVNKMAELWPGFCNSPTSFIQKICDTDTGELIAFASWTICNAEALVIRKLKGLDTDIVSTQSFGASDRNSEGSDDNLISRYLDCIAEKRHYHMGNRPYMHLNLLGTKPNHCRRGAAGMLMKWMGDFADNEGIHCYVESTEMGKKLYESHGYVTKDIIFLNWNGGSTVQYCMAREPAELRELAYYW